MSNNKLNNIKNEKEEEKTNFIRLKRKRTPINNNNTNNNNSSNSNNSNNSNNSYYNSNSHYNYIMKPRPECSNPLDRLCEKLLDWDIISLLEENSHENNDNNNNTDNNNNNNNINNNNNSQRINELRETLDSYARYSEYISIWEPLFIKETQASVYSSLSLEENFGKCKIVPLDLDEKYSSVVKFQCGFGVDDMTSNRFVIKL